MTIEQFQSAFPDWTDKSQYPEPEKFSLSQWAWEFLRRNPKYQFDFATLELETDQGVRNRRSLQTGTAYGLNRPMIDPRIPAIKLQDRIFQDGTPHVTTVCNRPIQISASEAAVIIDLTLPIDAQLKLAGPRLGDAQFRLSISKQVGNEAASSGMHYKKAQPQKYSGYLRVLDAKRTHDLTFQQIGEIIFPHLTDSSGAKLAGSAFKAAAALRDGKYRFLPLFEIPDIDYGLSPGA